MQGDKNAWILVQQTCEGKCGRTRVDHCTFDQHFIDSCEQREDDHMACQCRVTQNIIVFHCPCADLAELKHVLDCALS